MLLVTTVFLDTLVASMRRMSRCEWSLGRIMMGSMRISIATLGLAIIAPVTDLDWLAYALWPIFAVLGGCSTLLMALCAIFAIDDGVRAVSNFMKQQDKTGRMDAQNLRA